MSHEPVIAETERQRDRETEGQRDRETETEYCELETSGANLHRCFFVISSRIKGGLGEFHVLVVVLLLSLCYAHRS